MSRRPSPRRSAGNPLQGRILALGALLLAASLLPRPSLSQTAPPPDPGALFLHTERFEREDGSYAAADRGVLFVSQDRSRPDSGVLGVVFHRFPAHDSATGEVPPVFILHGGPGFGGLELEDPGYYEDEVEPYAAFTDVVVVGQRGFGPSLPRTECEGVKGAIFDPAVDEARRAEALREASRKCLDFWGEHGIRPEAMNVREAAGDVAEVAGALGYDRITLRGVSFGSHWAMAVLRYHPELVARALLSGMEGPDHTYDHPGWVLNVYRRVAEDAETAPELRPWIPEGGIMSALRETVERAERNPPTVSVEDPDTGEERQVTITADILRTVTDGYSSVPDSLHDMAAWPADILRLAEGRFDDIAVRALPDHGAGDEWSRIPDAAFFLLDCASGITEERAEEHFSDPAIRLIGPQAWLYRTACPEWGVDMGDEFRTGFRTDVPALVVHGNWDLSTPYENAVELMPAFRNGTLVTVERGTHGALDEALETSDSFREQVLRFLRTGETGGIPDRVTLPPVDWVVPAEPSPGDTASVHRYSAAVRASRAVLEALRREDGTPGLQVAVARGGEILWSEGMGLADVESGEPVSALTRFRIGSLSKPLTATAALALHREGRLDLDAPVRRYVPSFPEKRHPVTARQLLGHLAGIRHYRDDESQIVHEHYDDVVEALERFAGDSLLHVPGSAYEYSSYGYNLLSAAIQGASGRDYLRYMRDAVFRPLGMRHTAADHPDSLLLHRAEHYHRSENGALLNAPFTDNSYKWASGGFLSTAEDLVRFGTGLLDGRLLDRALVDTMFTSMVTVSGDTTGYAMGWRPRRDWSGRPVVRHGGSSVGARAFLMIWPDEELVVAILANVSLAPVFHQEAQTVAHFFLDHPEDADGIGTDASELAGSYEFTTRRGEEDVTGRLRLTGSRRHPGWMEWEGAAAPVPVVLVDRHGTETRLVGAGTHGVLNLWAEFDDDGFTGRWDWLGRTSEIRGRRLPHSSP